MSSSLSAEWDLFYRTAEALAKPLAIERPYKSLSDASVIQAKIPGAYLLMIYCNRPIRLKIRKFEGKILPAGYYTYAGNASGPGGLRARLARHLGMPGKSKFRPHWHIDHLTRNACEILALALPGGQECELHQTIIQQKIFNEPLKGFGASDCSKCDSHLAQWCPEA